MQHKNSLGRVNANADNLRHGRLSLLEIFNDLILAHTMPSGAVHPNSSHRPGLLGSGLAAARRPGMTNVGPSARTISPDSLLDHDCQFSGSCCKSLRGSHPASAVDPMLEIGERPRAEDLFL